MIVIVFGLPGSGKTYFAGKLASRINGLHISSDALRLGMQKQGQYEEQAKAEVYQSMLARLGKVAFKKNVVLDATFYKKKIRDLFKEKARLLGISLYFIEMKADELLIKDRISKKRNESEADFEVYLKIKSAFEPLEEEHLVLNSGREEIEEMLKKAVEYIKYRDEHSPDQQTH